MDTYNLVSAVGLVVLLLLAALVSRLIAWLRLGLHQHDETLWMGDGSSKHFMVIEKPLASGSRPRHHLVCGVPKDKKDSTDPNDIFGSALVWVGLSPDEKTIAVTTPHMAGSFDHDGAKLLLIDLTDEKRGLSWIK